MRFEQMFWGYVWKCRAHFNLCITDGSRGNAFNAGTSTSHQAHAGDILDTWNRLNGPAGRHEIRVQKDEMGILDKPICRSVFSRYTNVAGYIDHYYLSSIIKYTLWDAFCGHHMYFRQLMFNRNPSPETNLFFMVAFSGMCVLKAPWLKF